MEKSGRQSAVGGGIKNEKLKINGNGTLIMEG